MDVIHTSNAPEPAVHYAQGVVRGSTLYVSGQLPVEPGTGKKITDGI